MPVSSERARRVGQSTVPSSHLVYFSPTGTTRQVVHAIARGLGSDQMIETDLTRPEQRQQGLHMTGDAVVILAVPVYEERVPDLLEPWLQRLRATGQPAILVAVYGNVGFGITLRQLHQYATRAGLRVVAAGSFIGEHSYSHNKLPIADGRPDQQDIALAEQFGRLAAEKLSSGKPSVLEFGSIPGHLPPIARILPTGSAAAFVWAPAVDRGCCPDCGLCVRACPTGAIDRNTLAIDESRCLRCFACVRKCPQNARRIRLRKQVIVRTFLKTMGGKRREPAIYL